MTCDVYYNENDPKAATWLRELIARGLIAPGDVDERSIVDVRPDDVRGYGQCHFFAGIGGWSYALRLAGWPDDHPVWTGSCPCQPFSVAGRGLGTADARHLWPEFWRLIGECRPGVVFGEQVSGPAGRAWLTAVRADLEAGGYAVGAADLAAAGVGAPHIRQRLYWLADAERGATERYGHALAGTAGSDEGASFDSLVEGPCPDDPGRWHVSGYDVCVSAEGLERLRTEYESGLAADRLADTEDADGRRADGTDNRGRRAAEAGGSGAWGDVEYLPCIDGKARPTQPGISPLVDGVPARVVRLRGYGNAIVPQVAAEFIGAYMDISCA